MSARPKVFDYDLGIVGGRIIVYVGRWHQDTINILTKKLNLSSEINEDESPGCFGLCYSMTGGKSLIWLDGNNKPDEVVEAAAHELSHALDNWQDYFSYTDKELRARIHGYLTARIIKDLKLVK